jgi:hypothetical protein
MGKAPDKCPKCGAEGTMRPIDGEKGGARSGDLLAAHFAGAAGILLNRFSNPKVYQCSKCLHMVER